MHGSQVGGRMSINLPHVDIYYNYKGKDKDTVEEVSKLIGLGIKLLFAFRRAVGDHAFIIQPEHFVMNGAFFMFLGIQKNVYSHYRHVKKENAERNGCTKQQGIAF